MHFSPYVQYATRALAYLAEQETSKRSLARDIAEQQDIPLPMLSKVMAELTKSKLVSSTMGPGGGFRLAIPPEEITCDKILNALNCDFDTEFMGADMCLLGLPDCDDQCPCPLHGAWLNFRQLYRNTMSKMTLQQVVEVMNLRSGKTGKCNTCSK